jgi:phosphoglycerate dehydrogenase-like enzyme
MTKVLILDIHADIYRDRLRQEFPELEFTVARNRGELPDDLSDIDVLITFGIEVSDALFKRTVNLKWVQSLATGVDHFLRCPSLGKDIPITSGRGIHGAPMRETVVYQMMAISRDVNRNVENNRQHRWERRFWSIWSGKTAVIAGTGIVGAAIGKLLQAFDMRVIGVSRSPRQAEGFDEIMPLARLAEAAARADYVINILPASTENLRRFDATVFAAMKPSAYYISAGRGQTVDEPAMIAALREGRIAGAALDVFETEPLPADSPFWDLPNLYVTSHIGGYFIEYEDFILPLIVENMRLFLAGEPKAMRNLVAR